MKVLNIHKAIIHQSKDEVSKLLKTLSTENDKIWPFEKWPAMKFNKGLVEGANGGHGPIRYSIEKYEPKEFIQFKFSKPIGFNGIHKFEILKLENEKTELKHTIDMNVVGKGLLIWLIAIHPLHNALLEDALHKVKNNYILDNKQNKWGIWVKLLRRLLKKRS